MTSRRPFLASLAALAGLAWLAPLAAQPAQTTILSGFPVGGLGDQVTRPLIEKLKGRHPGTLLYDAKPGAGGRIAVEVREARRARRRPLLQMPISPMVLYPHTYAQAQLRPAGRLHPVTPTGTYAFSMTAGPGLPAEVKNVADYLVWAKANPQQGELRRSGGGLGAALRRHDAAEVRRRGTDERALPRRRASAAPTCSAGRSR